MKERVLKEITRILLAVFVLTACCMIASQPAFSDFLCVDGRNIVFAGEKYTLDSSFVTGVQKVLSFNERLFGSFLWSRTAEGIKMVFDLACEAFELCSRVIENGI